MTEITIQNIPADILAKIEAFCAAENALLPAFRERWGLPWLEDNTIESAAYILILRALDEWDKQRRTSEG